MKHEKAESVARKLAETTEAMRRCRIDAPEYSVLYWEKRRLKDAMRRIELGGAKARQGEETAGNPSGPSGHHSGACRPVLTGNSPPDCFPGARTPFRGGFWGTRGGRRLKREEGGAKHDEDGAGQGGPEGVPAGGVPG